MAKVIGVAADDCPLAEALYEQACFDYCNADLLLKAEYEDVFPNAAAMALAQLQQCCEKALKAWIILEKGRQRYSRFSHRVWNFDLNPHEFHNSPRTWNENIQENEI